MNKDKDDVFTKLFCAVKLEGSYRLIGGEAYDGRLVATGVSAPRIDGPSMDADIAQLGNHAEHGPCIFIRPLKASKWVDIYRVDKLPYEDPTYEQVKQFMGAARFVCREKTKPNGANESEAANENA